MPIKKSAFKALKQDKKKAAKNKAVKDNIDYLVKKAKKSIEDKKKDEASDWVKKSVKAIDKAIATGRLKKNTGARKKSRMIKKLNQLGKS